MIVWVSDEVSLESTVNAIDSPMGHLIPAGYFDPEVGLAVLLFRPIMAIPALSATVRRLMVLARVDGGASYGFYRCLY